MKRKILIILTIIFIALIGFNFIPKQGDINKDGEISITDLVIINRALHGTIGKYDYRAADMDKDGAISQSDLRLIEDIILKR